MKTISHLKVCSLDQWTLKKLKFNKMFKFNLRSKKRNRNSLN